MRPLLRLLSRSADVDPPADPKATATWAIAYVLACVRHDRDLNRVVSGSEAERRLCVAYAALTGMPTAHVVSSVRSTLFDRTKG